MLIAYGGGSEAGGASIHAGPPGRIVWDDDLSDQKVSESSDHPMPKSFNQPGNRFPEVAKAEFEAHFTQIAQRVFANIPADILQACFSQ